jgi:nucleoside phosphorylase
MRGIAIFTALRMEMSPLKGLLSRAEQVSREIPICIGEMEGRHVMLVRSGMGKERARAAAEFLCSKYTPHVVLSTGFGGGLVPDIRPSDVVLSSWVVSDANQSQGNTKKLLLEDQASRLQRTLGGRGIRVHVGGFACVSRPVVSPTQRSALAHRTGAVLAEMETFHLGEFFIARGVPFMGMRTVVDGLTDRIPLPESITEVGEWPGILNAVRDLLTQRDSLVSLRRLYQNGRRAQISLAKSVAVVIRSWP